MQEHEETKANSKKVLIDLTTETHSPEKIILESRKLLTYILGCCSQDYNTVMDAQLLNKDNPVHNMGMVGSFISEIFLRDMQKMKDQIEALTAKKLAPISEGMPPLDSSGSEGTD
jgi:hypothetical protein